MRQRFFAKVLPALALVGWQAGAAMLHLAGQTDAVLAYLPDPAWLVTLYAAVISPPSWLSIIVLLVAFGLLWTALLHRKA